jgi:hypothetical protein
VRAEEGERREREASDSLGDSPDVLWYSLDVMQRAPLDVDLFSNKKPLYLLTGVQ